MDVDCTSVTAFNKAVKVFGDIQYVLCWPITLEQFKQSAMNEVLKKSLSYMLQCFNDAEGQEQGLLKLCMHSYEDALWAEEKLKEMRLLGLIEEPNNILLTKYIRDSLGSKWLDERRKDNFVKNGVAPDVGQDKNYHCKAVCIDNLPESIDEQQIREKFPEFEKIILPRDQDDKTTRHAYGVLENEEAKNDFIIKYEQDTVIGDNTLVIQGIQHPDERKRLNKRTAVATPSEDAAKKSKTEDNSSDKSMKKIIPSKENDKKKSEIPSLFSIDVGPKPPPLFGPGSNRMGPYHGRGNFHSGSPGDGILPTPSFHMGMDSQRQLPSRLANNDNPTVQALNLLANLSQLVASPGLQPNSAGPGMPNAQGFGGSHNAQRSYQDRPVKPKPLLDSVPERLNNKPTPLLGPRYSSTRGNQSRKPAKMGFTDLFKKSDDFSELARVGFSDAPSSQDNYSNKEPMKDAWGE